MKKNLYVWVGLVMLLASTGILQAQTPEQRARLLELSAQFSSEFAIKKAEAIRWAEANNLPVRQELEDGTIIELMFLDENGMPMYYTTYNAGGAALINSDELYTGGAAGLNLSGAGQTLGIWDGGGTLHTHQELTGRVTQIDAPASTHWHATHVAGTMIAGGVVLNAKGMSYGASLDAYDWDDDATEMTAAAAGGLKVSQHSYGAISGWRSVSGTWYWYGWVPFSTDEDFKFGFYTNETQDWDVIANNSPEYLIVKSAGNDRGEGPAAGAAHFYWNGSAWTASNDVRQKDGGDDGFDCIPTQGNAKNIMTVGAVDASKNMSSFSGWGPTDDGRIKPDIVAKGVSVYSTHDGANNAYATSGGTSMSGPMVSGSIGLLLEHQENLHTGVALLSSTMKALVLHTAEDLGNPGPDYSYGWGLMDTEAAAAVMTAHAASPKHIFERTLNDGEEVKLLVKASGTDPLRATLAWTDVPGTPPTLSLNPTDLMLVNDLDMRITQLGGSTYEPFILDPANPASNATTGDNFRDNVEVVHIASPVEDGLYSLSITHKGSLSGGSQQFSLIITGNKELNEVYIVEAKDDATNYSESDYISQGNNGYGFGPWYNANSNGGYFRSNASEQGANSGTIDTGGNSFGMWANNPGFSNVGRQLIVPTTTGQSISFDIAYSWDNGNRGFTLNNGGWDGPDEVFFFNINSSGYSWSNGGSAATTPWPGQREFGVALSFTFTQNGNDVDFSFNSPAGGGPTASGTINNVSFDRIKFYVGDAGGGTGANLYFNSLDVETIFASIPANAAARIIGQVQQDADLLVEDLIIESPHKLNVQPGNNLTVNGSIVNTAGNSSFVLESDNTGTASLMHQNAGVEATIQRYIDGSSNPTVTRYHNVSVPLAQASDPTANLFMNAYLMYWDPVINNWQWITNPADILQVNRGYLTWYTGASTTINFAGSLNNGVFVADVPSNATDQFSLVPNPYPSAIDWDAASGWTKINLYDAVYVWSRDINNYRGYGNDQSINQGSRYIASGQAFWVRANDAAAGLSMSNNVRLHNAIPFREGDVETNILRIKAIASDGQDETVIRLLEGATDNFDTHADLFKLRGGEQAPQLYSISTDNEELSVYSLPFTTEVVAIPLAFEMGVEGDVNFIVSGTESFEADATLILEDRLTGTYHSLRQNGNLVFNHEPAKAPNRFFLYLFEPANVADQLLDNNATVWQAGNKLYIDHHEFSGQAGQISLFDMLGKKLTGLETSLDSPTVLDVSALKGPAVLHIRSNESTFSTKVVIN